MDERTRSPSGEHRNGRRHQHTNGSPRADSGSDVYVTSAAYRPPSEIRWVIPLCLYGHPIPFMETTLNKNSIVQNQREETGSVRLLLNNSPCKVSNIYPDKLSIESPRPQSYPLPLSRGIAVKSIQMLEPLKQISLTTSATTVSVTTHQP